MTSRPTDLKVTPNASIGWMPWRLDRSIASVRLRSFEPVALLQKQSRPVEIFDPDRVSNYKVVVLQKCYEPEHLALVGKLKAHGTHVVFDICDNHLYNPTHDPHLATRSQHLLRMLEAADTVTVSTQALAHCLPVPARVIRDGIPTPRPCGFADRLFLDLFHQKRDGVTELVWYGTPVTALWPTGMEDVSRLSHVLTDLSRDFPLRLTVVSSSYRKYRKLIRPLEFNTRYVPWGNYDRFCGMFPRFDACLIPITRNPFTLCKTNNRLALSLYLGVPVVADRIPSYEEFDPFCFLDDWSSGLRQYLESETLRRKHAEAGREQVLAHHMMEHAVAEWWQLLEPLI